MIVSHGSEATRSPASPAPEPPGLATRSAATRRPPDALGWKGVFGTGLVLWLASVLVTGLTGNLNMIPTIVLLGSFLVPATAVIWYLDHYHSELVTPALTIRAFIVGGVLGVLAASILEAWLVRDGGLVFVGAGLIEELAKLLALAFVARRLPRYTVRDGIVLGAAVGFGFAALESSGYALNALLVTDGRTLHLSLANLVETELLRGILAPVGHGLWTAILGGALFAAAGGTSRLHVTRGVVGAYLLVSVLHALWDSMGEIAMLVVAVFDTTAAQQAALAWGRAAAPTLGQIELYLALLVGGLALLSAVGFAVLWRQWHAAGHGTAADLLTARDAVPPEGAPPTDPIAR